MNSETSLSTLTTNRDIIATPRYFYYYIANDWMVYVSDYLNTVIYMQYCYNIYVYNNKSIQSARKEHPTL